MTLSEAITQLAIFRANDGSRSGAFRRGRQTTQSIAWVTATAQIQTTGQTEGARI